MSTKTLRIAAIALVALASPARATVIAGWDFSQYRGTGLLSTDGVSFTNTLAANYSSLDPNGAGAESAAFGTLYFDGSNGSSSVPAGPATTLFAPTAGSAGFDCARRYPVPPDPGAERGGSPPAGCTVPNVDGPLASNREGGGLNAFDSHSILRAEGQAFTERLAMKATGSVSLVFKADMSSVGPRPWEVSFGGRTAGGGGDDGGELACDPSCTSTVGIDFSTNGVSYTAFGSVTLDEADRRFVVPLGSTASSVAYVRLNLEPGSGEPIIDNVAVPEPAATAQLVAAAGALALLVRLRWRV
jgi:hypothetical protein